MKSSGDSQPPNGSASSAHSNSMPGPLAANWNQALVAVEDALLLGFAQPGKQRQYVDARRMVLAQVVGGLADLALAGQEDERVAGPPGLRRHA